MSVKREIQNALQEFIKYGFDSFSKEEVIEEVYKQVIVRDSRVKRIFVERLVNKHFQD